MMTPTESAADSAVMSAFPLAVMACFVVIAAVTAIRDGSSSKSWDDSLYVLCVVSAACLVLVLSRFHLRLPRISAVAGALASIGLAYGIVNVENPFHEASYPYWSGFGLSVLILALVLAPFIWRLFTWDELSRRVRVGVTVAAGLIALVDLTSALRSAGYIPDVVGNSYVLNELLAPAAGRVPDSNFIPQYSVLYGWLLKPFAGYITPGGLVQLAVAMMTACGVGAVILGVLIAYRALGRRSLALAVLLVVPITCVTVAHGANDFSSLFTAMPELSIRVFGGMLIAFLGINELVMLRQQAARRVQWVGIGLLSGLVAWNSEDLGLAAVTTLGILLLFVAMWSRRLIAVVWYTAGLFAGLVIYPAIAAVSGSSLKLYSLGFFERQFGSGFGSVPIQLPGPVLVVLPVIVGAAATGWLAIIRMRTDEGAEPRIEGDLLRATVTTTFIGTWALAGFLYYLNRSVAGTQLQVLLPLCGVACAGLVGMTLNGPSHTLKPFTFRIDNLRLLPVACVAALCLAATAQFPNPKTELDRFTSEPYQGYPTASMHASINDVQAGQAYVAAAGESVAYFGEGSNYIQLMTGVPGAIIFNTPRDFTDSSAAYATGCAYVNSMNAKWLILSDEAISIMGTNICGASYEVVQIPGVRPGHAVERI